MKNWKTVVVSALAGVVAWGAVAWGVSVQPLSVQEQARFGASHMLTLTHEDLDTLTAGEGVGATNTVVVLPSIPANRLVKGVLMRLPTAFQETGVSGFNTLTVTLGDSDDPDRYLTATQVNGYGTEVPVKLATANALLTTTATNMTATITVTSTNAPAATDAGELRFYFTIFEP